jgi:hypothetical protein
MATKDRITLFLNEAPMGADIVMESITLKKLKTPFLGLAGVNERNRLITSGALS